MNYIKGKELEVHKILNAHTWQEITLHHSKNRICPECGIVEWYGFGDWHTLISRASYREIQEVQAEYEIIKSKRN